MQRIDYSFRKITLRQTLVSSAFEMNNNNFFIKFYTNLKNIVQASLRKQHMKISLLWDENQTYLQVRLVRD